MKKITLPIVFILFVVFPMAAQMVDGQKTFPTRIALKSTNSSILLTWREAETDVSAYNIYRSSVAINAENLDKAEKIISIPVGSIEFEDYPPYENVPYFYAILPVSILGEEQKIFIPFSNLNLYGVTVLYTQKKSSEIALIRNIEIKVESPVIAVYFDADRGDRELLIYRHSQPITETSDLIKANLIGRVQASTGVYRDYPISGVSYFYLVLDSQTLLSGNIQILPGENTSIFAAALPFQDRGGPVLPANFALRPRPLPYLSSNQLYSDNGGPRPIDPQELDSNLSEKVSMLMDVVSDREDLVLMPTLLPEDRFNETTSDTRLKSILDNELLPGHWDIAHTLLENYSRLPQTKLMNNKLHFYLGQTSYFKGNNQDALIHFLFAEESHYLETKPWMWMVIRRIKDEL